MGSEINIEPSQRFAHDCADCVFLLRQDGDHGLVDYYYCRHLKIYVGRYGNDPEERWFSQASSGKGSDGVARRQAVSMGLVRGEDLGSGGYAN